MVTYEGSLPDPETERLNWDPYPNPKNDASNPPNNREIYLQEQQNSTMQCCGYSVNSYPDSAKTQKTYNQMCYLLLRQKTDTNGPLQ